MDPITESDDANTPSPAAASAAPPQKPLKQACDNCRRRKIKCNREQPCDKCLRLLLSCSYSDVLQRKGRKFRTLYPLASLQTLTQYPTPPQSIADQANQANTVESWGTQMPWSATIKQPSYKSYSSPDSLDSQYELANPNSFQVSLLSPTQPQPPSLSQQIPSLPSQPLPQSSQTRRLSPATILAHVNVYLKYQYPIIPVIRPEQVINDSQEPERLDPQRYAFLAALCAATNVQLQLDRLIESSSSPSASASLGLPGTEIVTEAINARNSCNNVSENVTIESLLTSFFLFAANGNLDRQDQAWFYLSQATSMALTLGLHRESSYLEYDETEGEERRNVFWLLFVTERAYALQQAKPIMLRNSIQKPRIIPTEDPTIQYGFHNLINIFERLTADLYDWIAIECDENLLTSMRRPSGHANLRDIQQWRHRHSNASIPIESVTEIQNLDIATTQQWLQVMMEKLSMSDLSQYRNMDALLPFHLPVLVAKAVMDVFQGSTVFQSHNTLERKLSSTSPTDQLTNHQQALLSSANDNNNNPNININNEEFLLDILNILTRIRRTTSSHHYPVHPSAPHAPPSLHQFQSFLSQTPSPSSISASSNQLFQ